MTLQTKTLFLGKCKHLGFHLFNFVSSRKLQDNQITGRNKSIGYILVYIFSIGTYGNIDNMKPKWG